MYSKYKIFYYFLYKFKLSYSYLYFRHVYKIIYIKYFHIILIFFRKEYFKLYIT